jgi:flagellar hook-associated protein 1 FlgK
MSISSIMGTGLSALAANQLALKTVSTNVANVNTVGYSRLDVQFVSRQAQGGMLGVEVEVKRIANAYLAAAEMRGAADVASADILAQIMDRAQGLMGDPSDESSVFAALDPVFSAFGALSVDPASALRRSESLSSLDTMLTQLEKTAGEITALRDEAHSRILSTMEEANSLMSGIARLNQSIQRSTVGGLDASQARTEQSRMLDRLSEIIDIRTQERPLGGIEVRTSDGLLLVDLDAATFGLDTTTDGEAYQALALQPPRTTTEVPLGSHIKGGELFGLLRARDKELVDLSLAFGEYAAGAADALNAAHNKTTAFPPPTSMTGQNSGLLATDRLNFAGQTNIGIVDKTTGALIRNYRVDFGAGTITDDLGAVTNFATSIGDFQAALDTAMTGSGDATFSAGVFGLSTSVANAGVVITDDPNNPATRAGKGFSHTFGLNNLVSKSAPLNYATGLSNTDLHGFSSGTITFALRDAEGRVQRTINYTVPAPPPAGTVATLRAGIDAALAGAGQTELDANGRLTLVTTGTGGGRIDVLGDTTLRGGTDLSASQIFGWGETLPADRGRSLNIRSDISADPQKLGVAKADLVGVAVGARVLASGDGRGALELEAAGSKTRTFATAGGLNGQVTTLSDYAARLAGHAGVRAEAMDAARAAAESVREEVKTRRMSEEGVNLDEELVKMTVYQQAYAAASRLIQAAKDLFDITLQMV